jgi:hypothetical protein
MRRILMQWGNGIKRFGAGWHTEALKIDLQIATRACAHQPHGYDEKRVSRHQGGAFGALNSLCSANSTARLYGLDITKYGMAMASVFLIHGLGRSQDPPFSLARGARRAYGAPMYPTSAPKNNLKEAKCAKSSLSKTRTIPKCRCTTQN